jgi:hypothetical protein
MKHWKSTGGLSLRDVQARLNGDVDYTTLRRWVTNKPELLAIVGKGVQDGVWDGVEGPVSTAEVHASGRTQDWIKKNVSNSFVVWRKTRPTLCRAILRGVSV